MSLPRFHRGRTGPVGFQDWNRVLAATEEIEAARAKAPTSEARDSLPLLARIREAVPITTVEVPSPMTAYKWTEVCINHNEPLEPWSFIDKPGGITEAYWSPDALAMGVASVGQVCILHRMFAKGGDTGATGRSWYAAVPLAATGRAAVGRIMAQTTDCGGLPAYTCSIIEGCMGLPGAELVVAYNTVERSPEYQAAIQAGAPNATLTALRIPNNTPIVMVQQSAVLWAFTLGTPYTVACT